MRRKFFFSTVERRMETGRNIFIYILDVLDIVLDYVSAIHRTEYVEIKP